jgi:hypothetical protein
MWRRCSSESDRSAVCGSPATRSRCHELWWVLREKAGSITVAVVCSTRSRFLFKFRAESLDHTLIAKLLTDRPILCGLRGVVRSFATPLVLCCVTWQLPALAAAQDVLVDRSLLKGHQNAATEPCPVAGGEALAEKIADALPRYEDVTRTVTTTSCLITIELNYEAFCERDSYAQKTVTSSFDLRELSRAGPVVSPSRSRPGSDFIYWDYEPETADRVSEITTQLLRERKRAKPLELPSDASGLLDASGIRSRRTVTTCQEYQYVSPEGTAFGFHVDPERSHLLVEELIKLQQSVLLMNGK